VSRVEDKSVAMQNGELNSEACGMLLWLSREGKLVPCKDGALIYVFTWMVCLMT
jgi:hypothetical protein